MHRTTRSLALSLELLTLTVLTLSSLAMAQTEQVLSSFQGGVSGSGYPNGGLVADSLGNFYGTTAATGNSCTGAGCGTVFKLVPQSGGRYERLTIHTFTRSGTGAWNPQAGLAMDSAGDLYGTTLQGGPENAGTVFKLSPTSGPWKFTVLHSFFGANNGDGAAPVATVTLDELGNVYGTTPTGGSGGEGVVYKIAPQAGGGYIYSPIHNFPIHNSKGPDGAVPWGPLVFDAAGNLYGAAQGGGANGEGAIYKLSPASNGGWTESVIYSFDTTIGNAPAPYIALDAAGNVYGTAAGGTGLGGVAFEVSQSGGTWTAQKIYDFCAVSGCPDGFAPVGFIIDSSGNLYGVATAGGANQSGTAVELSPPSSGGTWTATLLHTFGKGKDGAGPLGTMLYSGGKLFGATSLGGQYGFGTLFQITP